MKKNRITLILVLCHLLLCIRNNAQELNTCTTWTFQLQLSSPVSEQLTGVLQLSDDSYILYGNDSTASEINGRVVKLNKEGAVLQSKKLSLPNEEVRIHQMRYFSNGKLYGIATGKERGINNTHPLLLCLDTDNLSVLSAWRLSINSGASDWKGIDIQEGRENGIYMLFSNELLINVTKADWNSNNINWSKTYRTRNAPQPIGLGLEYADVYVAWNEQDSGFSEGVVMDLDRTTGNIKYTARAGGKADGRNIQLQSMVMASSRARMTAIQWKDGTYEPLRLSLDVSYVPILKEVFTVSGLMPTGDMRSLQNGWGEILAMEGSSTRSEIDLIQTFPLNFRTPIRSWRHTYPYPVELKALIRTSDGGNLVMAASAGAPQKIVVTKTDSVAMIPGCSLTANTASFLFTQQSFALDTIPLVTPSFQWTGINLISGDRAISVAEDCKTLYCPTPPQPDSCLRTFFKEYRTYSNSFNARALINIGNGKLLLHNSARADGYKAEQERTQLTVVDTVGRLIKSQILTANQRLSVSTVIHLKDGNMLGTGFITTSEVSTQIYLIKFDADFSILWQKKLVTTTPPHFLIIEAITESKEGDIYCYIRDPRDATIEARNLLKLDASGNPVWLRQFTIGSNIFLGSGEFVPAITELGDAIIMKYNAEDSDYSPFLMSIKKSDGSAAWVRKYQMPEPHYGSNSYYLSALVADDKNIFLSGRSQSRNILLKIGADGGVQLARRSPETSAYLGWMGVKKDNKLLTSVGTQYNGNYVNGLLELDTNLNILRTQYMQVPKGGRNAALTAFSDSVTYATGSLYNDNPYSSSSYFQKYNFNSSFASCAVTDPVIELETYTQASAVATVKEASLPLPQMVSYNAYFISADVAYSGYYCGNNTPCSSLTLKGTRFVCDTSQVYEFKAVRNKDCNGMVLWRLDTLAGQAKVLTMTDSLLQLKIEKSGFFNIVARVFANCGWLEDSLTVQTAAKGGSVNLGPDVSICPGNSLVLHAGPGFDSYLWKDGSTDSLLQVTDPGWYHVQATACGNTVTDSILVSKAPPIPFSVGIDRVKCNSDTLHLSAPAGFLNYSWSSDYRLSSTTARTVVANPLVDTVYYIKAEKTPGCFAFDTIYVTVRHSPPIMLGEDKSFCLGDSISFNAANPAFIAYQWSTGQATAAIVAKAAAPYSVIATTADGCRSYDTARVLRVYPLPVLSLDKNPGLCEGSTRTLRPGSFAQYTWSTGETTPTLTVDRPGLYKVSVIDRNGCKGSDSTVISKLHPTPSRFLPPDTDLCSYSSLELMPSRNFPSYTWSTGSSAATVVVKNPGLYWLEVTDGNNCKGRDSVIISPKDCMSGFYIPSAFTPNHDGKNDSFKPLLFGVVKEYRFTIFNRWGEMVFESTNPAEGWDGKTKQVEDKTSTFVWTCKYQLENGEPWFEKGTVVVIR